MNWLQTLVDAIGLGSVYALMAVGIGLVFGVMRLVNFAYGQLIMAGAYALAFTDSWGDPLSIAACLAVVIALSLLMELVAFRRLRNASPATMLAATFAISFLLQSIALLRYSFANKPIGDTAGTLSELNRSFVVGSARIQWVTIVAIVVAVVTLGALALFLNRTSIGLQMRAAAADFRTARMLGVRANTVILLACVLSGILAAIAAVILVVQTPLVTPDFALRDTIIVLVGIVVGGIDRLVPATLGGFFIGFTTGFLGDALPAGSRVYLPSAVFGLVVVVLLLRPTGLFTLFNKPSAQRV
ncbi:MAG: branched-chain amino acid ABC transporter permease [Actinomycetota bacterium]|nr:branched-chain amino acid ABC transporter permease [Actinomycetota bacterium]